METGLHCTGQGGPWRRGGVKAGPGHTLGLLWEGGTYFSVPCFCSAMPCPSLSCALFHVFVLLCMHPCIVHPPIHLTTRASVHPTISLLTLPLFPSSPLSICSSSHLLICLSRLSMSSKPSTLPSVHHRSVNKHLWSTRENQPLAEIKVARLNKTFSGRMGFFLRGRALRSDQRTIVLW